MTEYFDLFQNSTLQSMIISPLMGVLFGAIFSKPSKSFEPAFQPLLATREIIIIKDRDQENRDNIEPWAIIFILIAGMVILSWFYYKFFNEIYLYSKLFILGSIFFNLTIILMLGLQGRIHDKRYFKFLGLSLLQLIFVDYSLGASQSMVPRDIIEYAVQNDPIDFYMGFNQKGKIFIITNFIGYLFMLLLSIASILSVIYYISLVKIHSIPESGFWNSVLKKSSINIGKNSWVLNLILITIIFFFVEGHIFEWVLEYINSH